MEQMVRRLVSRMEQNHLIMPDQLESYIYVLQLKVESVISIVCLVALSCLFQTVIPTIFFLIAAVALKRRCGGIHADTFAQCLGSTAIIYIVFVKYILPLMLENIRITYFIYNVAFVIIEAIGAFNHPNMNWSREEYKKTKTLARRTAFIQLLVTMTLSVLNVDRTTIIFLMFAMMFSAILLLLAKIFVKEVRL